MCYSIQHFNDMGWQCGRDKNYDSCLHLMSCSTQCHNWIHLRLITRSYSKLRCVLLFTYVVFKLYSTWFLTDKMFRSIYLSIHQFPRHHPVIIKKWILCIYLTIWFAFFFKCLHFMETQLDSSEIRNCVKNESKLRQVWFERRLHKSRPVTINASCVQ